MRVYSKGHNRIWRRLLWGVMLLASVLALLFTLLVVDASADGTPVTTTYILEVTTGSSGGGQIAAFGVEYTASGSRYTAYILPTDGDYAGSYD